MPDTLPLTVARLVLGSTNAGKLEAVRRTLAEDVFRRRLVVGALQGVTTDTGVSSDPVGLEETLAGARNRAAAAFALGRGAGEAWGMGIESGSVRLLEGTGTLHHVDVCVITDGRREAVGVSSMFEYPRRLCEAVFDRGEDFQSARAYIDASPDLSQRGGVIGLLSAGVTDRIQTAHQAARLALIRMLDPLGKY